MASQPNDRQPNDNRPNIVLTGFMGTGKSTVGALLARRLGRPFVDTDQLIESRHGSIATIFSTAGEAAFRAIEREIAAELAVQRNLVIATGGRLMLDDDNRRALEATGVVFCLAATEDEILRRVIRPGRTSSRPLLAGDDPAGRVLALLAERTPGYQQFRQIATSGRTPKRIVDEILDEIADQIPGLAVQLD